MDNVTLSRSELERHAAAAGIEPERAEALWRSLTSAVAAPAPTAPDRGLEGANVLFYVGGLLTIAALSWLMGTGWDQYGAGVGLALAVVYALGFAGFASFLLARGWTVPGGLMATVVVALMPLIVFAFEKATGLWPDRDYGEYGDFYEWISSSWCVMEAVTIVAGLIALRLVRFPFLVAPVAFAAWFASMDVAEALFDTGASASERAGVSLAVGSVLIGAGLVLDRRGARPYAFWCHLFGLLCFTWALGYLVGDSSSETAWGATGLLGALGVVTAVLVNRRTYAVFGGVGLFSWTIHLAYEVFEDSLLFPLALAAIGVAIVMLGIAYTRNRERWRQRLLNVLRA